MRETTRKLATRGLAGCLGFVALLGCSDRGRDASGRVTLPIAAEPDVVVDVAALQQRITGFGASSAWHSGGIFDEQADLFFSPTEGIGLSLLRLRIAPEGTTVENVVAAKAHQRGVRVWAAPWSPPGAWKSNGEIGNGGRLLPEYYDDWAARLATFAQTKASEGIPLLALSAQNEPDWVAEWETCEWTPAEMTTFIRDHLGPELRARSPETTLLAPESANWDSLASYANAILDDEGAREEVGIIGVHDYGGTPYAYTAPADNGKEFWETEISYHDFTGIDVALQTANAIHEHLALAQVNAFHYWWLLHDNPDGALFSSGQLNPQGYALGQYSKFIRPGFHRVASTPLSPSAGVVASAFFDTAGGRLVIVAVNSNATAVEQTFGIAGSGVTSMVAWTTNESESLEPGTAFAVGESFAYSLGAKSITTFVGDGSSVGPGSGGAGGESGAEGGAANEGGASAGGTDAGGVGSAPANEGGESGNGPSGSGGTAPGTGGSDVGTGGSDVGTGGSDIEPTAGAPNGAGGTGTAGSSAGRGGRGGSQNSGDDDETRPRPGNACACRTAGVSQASHGSWILVLGLGLLASTRRRRRFATTP